MPYIPEDRRDALENGEPAMTVGELNFQFTVLSLDYLNTHGVDYARLNDVVGALESAKAEFQRRVVAPYEDTKIEENGDVYEYA